MGENKLDRAQLQTKVLKPSVFNTIHNLNSPPSGKRGMQLPPKYFSKTISGGSFNKGNENDAELQQANGVNIRPSIYNMITNKLG